MIKFCSSLDGSETGVLILLFSGTVQCPALLDSACTEYCYDVGFGVYCVLSFTAFVLCCVDSVLQLSHILYLLMRFNPVLFKNRYSLCVTCFPDCPDSSYSHQPSVPVEFLVVSLFHVSLRILVLDFGFQEFPVC